MITVFPELKEATKQLESLTSKDEKGVTTLGELAEQEAKGAAKGTAKNLGKQIVKAASDPKNYLSAKKFGEALGKGALKGVLDETGGWFSWAKWFWSTKDLVATLAKPTTPGVKLFELGYYLTFDVIKPVGEFAIKAQHDAKVKELAEKYDLVLAVYSDSADRFDTELYATMKDVHDYCKSVGDSFDSGFNKWLLDLLDRIAKKDPEAGEKWKNTFKPGILNTFRRLRELQFRMYGLNASAYIFSSACQYGKSDNATLGFPAYKGHVHPERQALLNQYGSDVYTTLLHSVERMATLDKFILALWKKLARRVGLTNDDFESIEP